MRPLLLVAVVGGVLSVNTAVAQREPVLPDSPIPRHHSPKTEEKRPAEGESEEKPAPAPQAAPPAPIVPTVQAAPPGPPQKNLTGDEFKLIHTGSTTREVLAVLGPPSSRVVIPDDDDHLRETLEYWVKGAPAATIRLDNGRVVQIMTKPK